MTVRNEGIEVLKSAARVAAPVVFKLPSNDHEACHIVIDVTAIGAAPSVVVTVRGVDPLSGKRYVILASAAIVAIGTTVLKVGRGLVAAANLAVNDMLPRNIEIDVAHGNGDSITYSVYLNLMRGG